MNSKRARPPDSVRIQQQFLTRMLRNGKPYYEGHVVVEHDGPVDEKNRSRREDDSELIDSFGQEEVEVEKEQRRTDEGIEVEDLIQQIQVSSSIMSQIASAQKSTSLSGAPPLSPFSATAVAATGSLRSRTRSPTNFHSSQREIFSPCQRYSIEDATETYFVSATLRPAVRPSSSTPQAMASSSAPFRLLPRPIDEPSMNDSKDAMDIDVCHQELARLKHVTPESTCVAPQSALAAPTFDQETFPPIPTTDGSIASGQCAAENIWRNFETTSPLSSPPASSFPYGIFVNTVSQVHRSSSYSLASTSSTESEEVDTPIDNDRQVSPRPTSATKPTKPEGEMSYDELRAFIKARGVITRPKSTPVRPSTTAPSSKGLNSSAAISVFNHDEHPKSGQTSSGQVSAPLPKTKLTRPRKAIPTDLANKKPRPVFFGPHLPPTPNPIFYGPSPAPKQKPKPIVYSPHLLPEPLPTSNSKVSRIEAAAQITFDPSNLDPSLALPRADTKNSRDEFSIDKNDWVVPEKDLKLDEKGRPPVWCQGRQELCESLPYFRSYQGGHYDLNERCIGYLLDGYPAPGDVCEAQGKIIISHGGGCSEGEGEDYKLVTDQKRGNLRVRALINCCKTETPVVLLAGKNYAHFNWLAKNNFRYCVLGYYFVRDFWVEAEAIKGAMRGQYFTRFKFLFEWVPSQGEPWFHDVISSGTSSLYPQTLFIKHEERGSIVCPSCHKASPDVYQQAIACLDERCRDFFKLIEPGIGPSSTLATLTTVTYRAAFLTPTLKSSWSCAKVPLSVFPESLQSLTSSRNDHSRSAWRGFWCSSCRKLSSRSEWRVLTCSNCYASVEVPARIFTPQELERGPRKPPILAVNDGIELYEVDKDGWEGWEIILADDVKVLQIWVKDDPGRTADRLFEEYQGAAMGMLLKRNVLTRHRVSGGFLVNQFSFNAGHEYNHVVSVDSLPFHDDPSPTSTSTARAPPCVASARDYIAHAVSALCPPAPSSHPIQRQDEIFNEVLSVAYMEGGKMSYHDDGEEGVGPVVASLSLGAQATMSFKRKGKTKASRGGKVAVQLQLRHGDVMIMNGSGVQRELDHMVEPVNLRFAATARFIHSSNAGFKSRGKRKGESTIAVKRRRILEESPADFLYRHLDNLPPLPMCSPLPFPHASDTRQVLPTFPFQALENFLPTPEETTSMGPLTTIPFQPVYCAVHTRVPLPVFPSIPTFQENTLTVGTEEISHWPSTIPTPLPVNASVIMGTLHDYDQPTSF